jgi:Phosphate transport (Pho88)
MMMHTTLSTTPIRLDCLRFFLNTLARTHALQPFADPSSASQKTYTRIVYATHVANTARSLAGSTLMSIVMTCGLHWYRGMVTGLAIQTVLAPLTAWENALFRAVVLSFFVAAAPKGKEDAVAGTRSTLYFLSPEQRLFGEKLSLDELNAETDRVVDEHGNAIKLPVVSGVGSSSNNNNAATTNGTALVITQSDSSSPKSYEDVLLDTWDDGVQANLDGLLQAVTIDNVNVATSEAGWTALMIVCGLHTISSASSTTSTAAIDTLISTYQANVQATDTDGWNCFHWAMFHGHRAAIPQLVQSIPDVTVVEECCRVLDGDGKTPLDIARQEGNDDMISLLPKDIVESSITSPPRAPELTETTTSLTEPKKEK